MESFYNGLCEIVGSDNVLLNEPMKDHTTFNVGGVADYYVKPHSTDEISKLLELCRTNQIGHYVIGNGSNLLVSDSGYRGVILQIYNNFSGVRVEDSLLTVKAGTLVSKVADTAYEAGLCGMEFSCGIPGTIGGAATMNAGAYGGEIKHIVEFVKIMDQSGKIKVLQNDELQFGYRTSVIKQNSYVVLEVGIRLSPGSMEEIKEKMMDYTARRNEKQPLEYPSAGSTFKRPEGMFAGKLIMDAGLKGYSVGGAKVSDKHCGFIINYNHANARDILNLVKDIQEKVRKEFGVELEMEVQKLGDFA